jgi:diacylglycerol O-acyltransferase / wax synthase
VSPRRLAALDEAFLAVETPSAHMHVGWAAVFDPPEAGPAPSFDELLAHISSRLHRAPRYRQMLRPIPFGLHAPVWVDDPSFDVRRQVKRAAATDLAELAEECMSEPLPRDRPLWQLAIADRLDDGRIGVVGKAHHCMVDGIAAVELATLLLDPDRDASEEEADDWRPEPGPGGLGLVAGAALDYARGGLDLLRLPGRLARSPRGALKRLSRAADAFADAVRPAPSGTPVNRSISPLRCLGLARRPLDDLIEIKRALDVTLNDVVLAVSAGGMREFLQHHGERPMRLKAAVPVNLRAQADAPLGNRVAFMFVDLPCDEPDPVRRVRELHAATSERKQAGEAQGGDDLVRSLSLAPSPLKRLASRLVANPRFFNLVVSNIPGPREQLFMRGCELVEAYPVVPIADEHSLSIGVTTVRDQACFGVYADRKSLPDAADLAAALDHAVDELRGPVDVRPALAVAAG